MHRAKEKSEQPVNRLCNVVGMSRQNYYKMRKCRQKKAIDEEFLLELIHRERSIQPRLGARKLLRLIAPDLADAGVSIGRDCFFSFLAAHGLLIEKKVRTCRTTNSRHGFRVYENLLKEVEFTAPHQVLVSDITYIRTAKGFVYLSLMMDAYSRTIVGFDCSDCLEATGALRALSMALDQLPPECKAIHHSDRGCQYCCKRYIEKLKKAGLQISMTQENHCYENAQAERLNGILKQEYGLGECFTTKADTYQAVQEAVWLYNHRRPHVALGYQFPMAVHQAA